MTAPVPLAEQPTSDDEAGLMPYREFATYDKGAACPDDVAFLLRIIDKVRAERDAAPQQHERAVAALRDEALVERIVRADFLQWSVYGGYNQETKEREWERMKRIELGAFRRRLASLLAALGGAANTAGDAVTTEEDKQNHEDKGRC